VRRLDLRVRQKAPQVAPVMLPANAVAQALIVGIGAKTGTQVLRDGVP